jgi:hypothetical protein
MITARNISSAPLSLNMVFSSSKNENLVSSSPAMILFGTLLKFIVVDC